MYREGGRLAAQRRGFFFFLGLGDFELFESCEEVLVKIVGVRSLRILGVKSGLVEFFFSESGFRLEFS